MTSKNNNNNNEENQLKFWIDEQPLETNEGGDESASSAADRRPKRKPATEVMKIVASKTMNEAAMKKAHLALMTASLFLVVLFKHNQQRNLSI